MSKKRVMRMRCTEKEVISFNERAAKAKLTPTAFMRSLLFPKKFVATKSQEEVIDAIEKKNVATKSVTDKNVGRKKKSELKGRTADMVIIDDLTPLPPAYRRIAEPGALLKK